MTNQVSNKTDLSIKHGKKLIITEEEDIQKKKVPADVPPFHMWATGADSYHGISGFKDLKEVWQSISKQGMWLWWELLYNRNIDNNIVKYISPDKAAARRVSRAYKELFKLQFICRVKQQTYLMNPRVVIPRKQKFAAVARHWDLVKTQEELQLIEQEL